MTDTTFVDTTHQTRDMFDVRCPRCGRLACYAQRGSYVQVKCGRCHEHYEFNIDGLRVATRVAARGKY